MFNRRNILGLAALAGFLVVGSNLQSAFGQFSRGGDRGDRGGDRGSSGFGGGGFGGGGFPGGGFGGGGFPGGGFGGGGFPGGGFGSGGFGGGGFGSGGFGSSSFGGGFNPTDMIRRMDGNGNGTLEPQEMEGRSRYFLERMVPGINLSQTISLEQLIRDVEKARGGSSSGTDTSRGSSSSSTTSSSTTKGNTGAKPLVLAFGVDVAIPTVPGFGDLASGASAPLYVIIDSDRKEADDRIAQYDRNRDGELDKDEIREGRWRDDPFSYDSNGDGRLSKEELAVRYAKRRVEEEKQRQERNGGQPSGNTPQGSAVASSSGGSSRLGGMIEDIFNRYDKNKSGVLEREEWRDMRTDPSAGDKDGDGKITREEITVFMESRFQQSGFGGGGWGGGGDSGGGGWGRDSGRDSGRGEPGRDSGRGSSSKTASTVDTRKSYKLVSANDKLPKGLPEWFTRNDANGDLQISMAEYSADWNDAKVAEFAKLDGNGDGVLTTKEVLEPKGTSSLASTSGSLGDRGGSTRGSSRFSFPSRDSKPETKPEPRKEPSKPTGDSVAAATPQEPPAETTPLTEAPAEAPAAADNGPVDPAYLKYAQGVIGKYDLDESGDLTKSEWVEMSKSPEAADANGDKRISAEEYARWKQKQDG